MIDNVLLPIGIFLIIGIGIVIWTYLSNKKEKQQPYTKKVQSDSMEDLTTVHFINGNDDSPSDQLLK